MAVDRLLGMGCKKPMQGRRLASRALLLVVCALLCSCLVCATPSRAHALVTNTYPSAGSVDIPVSGTFYFCFANNVAADSVFSNNARHVYLVDEDGVSANFSVSRLFAGDTPSDCPPGIDPAQRHYLYINVSDLKPGTTYTMGVSSGITTQGGSVENSYSVVFTTAGQKPDGDGVGDGTGGGVGDGTGGEAGGTGDETGGAGFGEDNSIGSGEEADSNTDSQTSEGTSVDSPHDSVVNTTEKQADLSEQSPATADLIDEVQKLEGESDGADESGFSGGGTGQLFVVNTSGFSPSGEEDAVEEKSNTLPFAVLVMLAVLLAAAGAAKRGVWWRKHAGVLGLCLR